MAQRIKIVRGTTNTFNVEVTDANGGTYAPLDGDKVIFGVRRLEDENPIFTREGNADADGTYSITINPSDTAGLDPGRYFYDVGLLSGENFYNIIEFSPFDIIPNVTKWEGTQ